MSELSIILDRPGFTPGEEVTGRVVLQLDAPVTARGVRLRLFGEEYTHVTRSTGKTSATYYARRPIIDEELVFAGEERLASFAEGVADVWNALLERMQHLTLPAGTHSYPFVFALPANAPPTYDGSSAEVEYRLIASVDVPLWIDLRRKCDLLVYPRAQPLGTSSPVTARYPRPDGERGFWEDVGVAVRPKVRTTLSLPRSRYGIGQVIDGVLAVEETGGAAIRGVEFTLVACEEARAQGQTNRISRQAARLYQPWSAGENAPGSVAFELEVLEGIVPSLWGAYFSLAWAVRARLDLALAADVTLAAPVTIVVGDGTT